MWHVCSGRGGGFGAAAVADGDNDTVVETFDAASVVLPVAVDGDSVDGRERRDWRTCGGIVVVVVVVV